jgi:integrase
MASLRKRGRVWYYRVVDADGVRREFKGCPDRRETEAMAAAAALEASKVKAGLIDPKALGFRDHEARPLADHLTDFRAYLIGKNTTEKHANLTHNRVARLIDLARARRVSDLAPSRIQAALKAIRDEGLSLRSIHHHVRAVKAFSRWLWRDGRARDNSLTHLTTPNPDTDRRYERRALTPDELIRTVQAAERGGVVLKLTGPDRAMLYRVAAGTGFRAEELASLTPEGFDLDGDPPTVTVTAAYSKRRRHDIQPIRPELADALRPWLATKAPGRPVFGKLTKHTALMLRRDLDAAGVVVVDASGRVADFHALRHSYITALVKSPAPVKVVQTLARHSTPTLTLGVYAHIGVFDQTSALDALPDLTTPAAGPESAALAATGTEGGRISKLFAPPLPHIGDGTGRIGSDTGGSADVNPGTINPVLMMREPLENKGSDASGRVLTATDGAEGVGFEPTVGLTLQRFSRPPRSTTLAPLRNPRRLIVVVVSRRVSRTGAGVAGSARPVRGLTRRARWV